MNSINKQLNLARLAWSKAGDAQKDFNAIIAQWRDEGGAPISPSQISDADAGIRSFMRTTTEVAMLLDRKIKDRQAKLDATTILEAVIHCGDESRKIVVAKPNGRIDEPFISETFYNAIRAKWQSGESITTSEDFDIVVINRKGTQVNQINRSK